MAQLDAYLTGDQEVAGSMPSMSTAFFSEIMISHSLPSADSRRAVVSFWQKKKKKKKKCAQYWLTAKRTKPAQ